MEQRDREMPGVELGEWEMILVEVGSPLLKKYLEGMDGVKPFSSGSNPTSLPLLLLPQAVPLQEGALDSKKSAASII